MAQEEEVSITDETQLADAGAAKHDTMSPTERLQRRDSLEKHLQTRPEVQDLKNRNILLDTNAAPSVKLLSVNICS